MEKKCPLENETAELYREARKVVYYSPGITIYLACLKHCGRPVEIDSSWMVLGYSYTVIHLLIGCRMVSSLWTTWICFLLISRFSLLSISLYLSLCLYLSRLFFHIFFFWVRSRFTALNFSDKRQSTTHTRVWCTRAWNMTLLRIYESLESWLIQIVFFPPLTLFL